MDTPAHESDPERLPPASVRRLLRKLRDLDFHSGPIAVDDERQVALAGCISLDHSAEHDLRYRVDWAGANSVLSIAIAGSSLISELRSDDDATQRASHPLAVDAEGRITAPALAARVHPETSDPRELEHFLRRIIRGAVA